MTSSENELSHRDQHTLNAVSGWLMLGSAREALAEFELLSPSARAMPEVLEVEWGIHAETKDWARALDIARSLIQRTPDRAFGWIHQAYSLRRIPGGGLEAAWEALLPAAARFPTIPLIPYNLACYAAQMGKTEEAWRLIQQAVNISGEKEQIKKQALRDDDLRMLWDRIKAMK